MFWCLFYYNCDRVTLIGPRSWAGPTLRMVRFVLQQETADRILVCTMLSRPRQQSVHSVIRGVLVLVLCSFLFLYFNLNNTTTGWLIEMMALGVLQKVQFPNRTNAIDYVQQGELKCPTAKLTR